MRRNTVSMRKGCSRWKRECASLAKTGKRQSVSPSDTSLLENVFQVDFYRTWTDPQFARNLLVFHAVLHQRQHLEFAWSEIRVRTTHQAREITENRVLHPGGTRGDCSQTVEQHTSVGRLPDDSLRSGLDKP